MFNKLFGYAGSKRETETNAYYQRQLAEIFNNPVGQEVLAWLIKTQMIDMVAIDKNNISELAYENGRLDFIRWIIKVTDFDFNEFMKGK